MPPSWRNKKKYKKTKRGKEKDAYGRDIESVHKFQTMKKKGKSKF